jgi:hypothetical protein
LKLHAKAVQKHWLVLATSLVGTLRRQVPGRGSGLRVGTKAFRSFQLGQAGNFYSGKPVVPDEQQLQ